MADSAIALELLQEIKALQEIENIIRALREKKSRNLNKLLGNETSRISGFKEETEIYD